MTTWMIVEDEPGLFEMFIAMCEMWGLDAIAFTDGEAACEWIEAVDQGRYTGELPELALLDDRLPTAISGLKIGERLRQSPALQDIAIILTTAAFLKPEQIQPYLDSAHTPYMLRKPWPNIQVLQQIFRQAIKDPYAQNKKQVIWQDK